MNGMGVTLTAEEIYSDKVWVWRMLWWCSEMVVQVWLCRIRNGFTNHHCGFGAIQQHSTVEHNYLKDGFTAEKLEDEIPTPGLTVKFLKKHYQCYRACNLAIARGSAWSKTNKNRIQFWKCHQTEAQRIIITLCKQNRFYSEMNFMYLFWGIYRFVLPMLLQNQLASSEPIPITGWPVIPVILLFSGCTSAKDGKPAAYSKIMFHIAAKRFAAILEQRLYARRFQHDYG